MKKRELVLILALCLSVILTSFSSFSDVCDAVRADTLRLHIPANSNSEADQEAKLYVRDEILRVHGDAFAYSLNKKRAVQTAQAIAEQVKETAEKALKEKGMSYGAEVEIIDMYFPITEYEDFTLPAGRYKALRVKLGEAKGKNWFCVMFPPLCVPAARDEAAPGYTEDEKQAISSPYKVKFAVVEWLKAAKESILNIK